jgi:hypothetical protein
MASSLPNAESVFWGIAIASGLYLLSGWVPAHFPAAPATAAATAPAAPAGGHYMPNGQWMADSAMGGMGCGMNGGGGCGCGHH